MKIGFTYPYATPARRAAELIQLGARSGLSSLWIYENLYGPGAFATAGFAAAHAQGLEVSVGATSPFTRTPGALAMESYMLNELTDGRFTLGIAASNPRLIEGMGGLAGNPLAAIRDTLNIVRQAGGEGIEDYRGARFSAHELSLLWDAPHGPPSLVVGTLKPKVMDIAAELADGVLLSSYTPLKMVAALAEHFRSRWSAHGRTSAPRVVAYVPFSYAETEQGAIELLRPRVAAAIRRLPVDPTIGELLQAGGAIDHDEAHDLARQLLASPSRLLETPPNAHLVPDRVVRAHSMAATRATLPDLLDGYRRAGVTEIVLFELTMLNSVEEAFAQLACVQQ